jgi:uroporphyrinogen decarboxylase
MKFCERLPDYSRVENALAFKEIDRVPNFEVCVSRKVREALFGCELPDGLQSELFYRPKLGYDYIFLVPPYWKPPVYSRQTLHTADREWVDQHSSMITDWASFKAYDLYPEPVNPLNLAELRQAVAEARRHPGRLGVGALLPSCPFTEINLLMGYENFSIALYEDFDLCRAIVDKMGQVGVAETEQLVREDVDFIFFGDDMAYTGGMMISPEVTRDLFFPWYRRYIQIARDAGKAMMFHSDGNIEPIIPDFIAAGLNGLNPIEPLAMDIVKLTRQYAGQLALMGNVDVDLLSRGTPEEIDALTKKCLDELKGGGGYLLASSNSICDYVKPENYMAMINANSKYGGY